jgi:hypothetical protein
MAGLLKRSYPFEEAEPDLWVCSSKIATKANLKLRWAERISSSHLPAASFTYEVTFPSHGALGFEVRSRHIRQSEDSDSWVECFVVMRVLPFFSNLIYPGDILLRLNGQSLLRKAVGGRYVEGALACEEQLVAATAPLVLRIVRPGTSSLNFMPSPVELNLFQSDKHIAAKFLVTVEKAPTGEAESKEKEEDSKMVVEASSTTEAKTDDDAEVAEGVLGSLKCIEMTHIEPQVS